MIVTACEAGVNTSSLAVVMIEERLLKEGIMDGEVKKCLIQEIDKFHGRMNLVILRMKAYVEFNAFLQPIGQPITSGKP
jgi:galactitol-specific phosphotransferase system IIB component